MRAKRGTARMKGTPMVRGTPVVAGSFVPFFTEWARQGLWVIRCGLARWVIIREGITESYLPCAFLPKPPCRALPLPRATWSFPNL